MKRLSKDYARFNENPPYGCSITPLDESMGLWRGLILGPDETPYADGIFEIEISIPPDYPFTAPTFKFITKIHHPNVSSEGITCIDVLKENWAPSYDLLMMVQLVQALLANPNYEKGYFGETISTGGWFWSSEESSIKKAKEMTYEYAIKSYK